MIDGNRIVIPQGNFKFHFELSDIVFVRTWFTVQIPQFFNPVTTLLLPPDQKNQWQGMKTVGQLRREKNIKRKVDEDSLYKVCISCIKCIYQCFTQEHCLESGTRIICCLLSLSQSVIQTVENVVKICD